MLRLFVAGLVLMLAAGCTVDAGGDEEDPVCEPGKVTTCPCQDGSDATQTCKPDGSGWGACGCSMLTPEQSDPDVACKHEFEDVGSLSPGDRCNNQMTRVFLTCSREIVNSGRCAMTPSGVMYCCAPN